MSCAHGGEARVDRIARRPGEGERVTVTLQATGVPVLGYDPVLQWVRLAQLAWTPWLAIAGALWALPRIMDRR